jgi:hypothetical protein
VTLSDFIWQALVILAFGAGGAAVCRARLKGLPVATFSPLLRRTLHLYLALPLLLLFPFINVYIAGDAEIQWDMPGWLQLHWAALSWAIVNGILAYVFGFCCMSGFARNHRWKWGPVCFGAAVLAVIQVYAGWSSRPNLPRLGATRISSDGVILQTSASTCVPASGANIAAMLGVHTSEQELAKLCHTTRDGTFPAQALRGMKELGIAGRKVTASGGIRTVHPPAMLFVVGDTHAMVYAGMTGGLAEIWNPSSGKMLMPESRLDVIWGGHALEFQRDRY